MFDRSFIHKLDIVYEHDIFTKTTRLTFVERLANYTITVHADISQPETYLNVIIIVLFFVFSTSQPLVQEQAGLDSGWMDGCFDKR